MTKPKQMKKSRIKQKQLGLSKYDHVNISVFNLIKTDSSVLDVGCWNGSLGKALIKEKKCIVDGIDANKNGLTQARKSGYRNTYLKDLNNMSGLDIEKEEYDYIIFADVLEHILHPEEILSYYSRFLKTSGSVIVSLPNIGFVLFRVKHLFGQFDYKEVGVMDKTHLKFYTLKTMKDLFLRTGFHVVRYVAHNEVAPKHFLLHSLKHVAPALFSLQFVFEIKKEKNV